MRRVLLGIAVSSAVLLAAPLAAAAQTAAPAELTPLTTNCATAAAGFGKPTTCSDNKFRPNPDGFSFENYGDPNAGRDKTLPELPYPYVDLTSKEMTYLFGTGQEVCSNAPGATTDNCDLTPNAEKWMDDQNKDIRGGHCTGFSILSLLYRKGQLGTSGPTFNYQNSPTLQHLLAYAWNFYGLQEVTAGRYGGTDKAGRPDAISPNQMLERLIQVLQPDSPDKKNDESYTLGVWTREPVDPANPNKWPATKNGHAVTPYAVQKDSPDLNNKKYTVLVYDNNYPGQTREVHFDTGANTFSYYASTNPKTETEPYTGTQYSATIDLTPTKAGLGSNHQPVWDSSAAATTTATPGAVATSPGGSDNVELVGGNFLEHANLIMDDGNPGHQIGHVNNTMVTNYPGATYDTEPAFDDYNETAEPTYTVPQTVKNVVIDGRNLHQTETQSLGLEGHDQSVGIDNLPIQPGQYDALRLNNGANDMTFTSNQAIVGNPNPAVQSPTLRIGANNPDMDPDLRLKMLASPQGNTLHITLNPANRTMTLQTSISGVYQFSGTDQTPTGDHQLPTQTLAVTVAHPVTLSYA